MRLIDLFDLIDKLTRISVAYQNSVFDIQCTYSDTVYRILENIETSGLGVFIVHHHDLDDLDT